MISNLRAPSEELLVQTLCYLTRKLLQHWTESSIIPDSKKKNSLQEQKVQKEDRFLRGRQIAYKIYEYLRNTGTNDSVENYADQFTIVLRNFIINDANLIWWHFEKLQLIKNTRVWETQDRIGIVQYGDSSKESWTWLSQIEHIGKKKYRAEFTNEEFLRPETEIMRETSWSKIRGQNSVNKEVLEIVGNGKLTDSTRKERITVSDTIRKSVQKPHSQILLQDLLHGRMWKMHRDPEVLETEIQVREWPDCLAKITSKELAPIHSLKNGILQNAGSTSPRMDADLEKKKCSYAHRQVKEQPSKRFF